MCVGVCVFQDLALNNPQRLIYRNEPTNQPEESKLMLFREFFFILTNTREIYWFKHFCFIQIIMESSLRCV